MVQALRSAINHIVVEARKTTARFEYDRKMPVILRAARNKSGPLDVLDAGCGDGRYSDWFAQDRYVGMDPGLIEEERIDSPSRRFVRSTIESMPFEDKAFDLIFCSMVIEHITDVKGTLESLRRVLRPDGVLVLTTATRHARVIGEMQNLFWNIEEENQGQAHHYFKTSDLTLLHNKAGFCEVEVSHIGGPFGYAFECLCTLLHYAGMKARGETYSHGRDSIIDLVNNGAGPQNAQEVVTWKTFVRAILLLPKYLGSYFCCFFDGICHFPLTKIICVVAR